MRSLAATILLALAFVINTPNGYLRWVAPGQWQLVQNPNWATSFGSHAEANSNAQMAGLKPGSFWIERTGSGSAPRVPPRKRR